ncbi:MAG: GTP cyclohydrolase I FolE2 [Armatimonadetes bacterium]|nr:GTP cyclohydrolase I FolE2 [Armatimonadota bacterium]NIM23027.1 GTP cyclohydrolase I FolE2 [Armatimonadota bacterium]NIM66895.1 GTP cyclohydrolase I FolE2 [Armatimonadota bacterium]NIM75429.1 GTP cyclohydrolase I FolE2 [Armatimonadota bacterium]NIN05086.1 GTP cyclohydrolase I FolE2 [Armatimonadota bacterium]
MSHKALSDVAAEADNRGITIQRVGVKDVHLPIQVRRKTAGFVGALARIDLAVELPHHFRGTHMSRFVEVLFDFGQHPIGPGEIAEMLAEARKRLGARRADLRLAFKYFITKSAPATSAESALDYDCLFEGEQDESAFVFTLGVEVPVTLLCPCSKEISSRGAHSQRATVRVKVRTSPGEIIWIEDLVSLIEAQGSSGVYPVLKREDEKSVTEQAYDNPKFVEDILRDVVSALRGDSRITWFEVSCESMESIHNHSVFAYQQEERKP